MKEDLGIIIRKLRKKQKLTLNNIANKTGLSISFLSQLERGKSSATLESIKKLSQALQVEPGYFFNEFSKEKQTLTQESTLETEHMKKHNIYYKSLHGSINNPMFVPHLVTLKPYQNKGNLIKHPGQEFIYVLEGELTVQVGKNTYILTPSNSTMFDSNKEHYWYNYSDKPVIFLCINYDDYLH